MNRSICFVFAIMTALCACREKKPAESASGGDEWPQLDAFHFLMAESFHPYADSGNLAPARVHAAEMAALAKAWSEAELPAKVDNDEVRALLKRLSGEAAGFANIVAAGDDAQTGKSLRDLHDLFHAIQERWYAPHEDHPPR